MRRFLIIAGIVLAVAYAVGIPLFLGQDDDPLPPKADAIVVLAGSDNRLPVAQALFGGGLAPMLVVSADKSGRDPHRAALCKKPPAGVVCVHAGPATTEGEAQAVGELAKEKKWNSIILVTSRYQMFRAGRIFDRCVDAKVAQHGVDDPWWQNAIQIPLEWIKLAVSETVRRRC